MDQYTHEFKFEVNGSFVRGECEFDTDGEASFRFDELSQPLPLKTIKQFQDLMEMIKGIHDDSGEGAIIKKIIVKEK